MKEDTVKLLKAVESGCYMAVNSFKQFEEYELKEDKLYVNYKVEEALAAVCLIEFKER